MKIDNVSQYSARNLQSYFNSNLRNNLNTNNNFDDKPSTDDPALTPDERIMYAILYTNPDYLKDSKTPANKKQKNSFELTHFKDGLSFCEGKFYRFNQCGGASPDVDEVQNGVRTEGRRLKTIFDTAKKPLSNDMLNRMFVKDDTKFMEGIEDYLKALGHSAQDIEEEKLGLFVLALAAKYVGSSGEFKSSPFFTVEEKVTANSLRQPKIYTDNGFVFTDPNLIDPMPILIKELTQAIFSKKKK